MFDKDNKFGFINNNENSNNNIEGLDKIKTDINNIKDEVNELNTQYKDLENKIENGNIGTVSNAIEPQLMDMPRIYFSEGTLPTSKTATVMKFDYYSKTATYHGYVDIKCQGNSSMSYPKKNFTIKLYKDKAKTEKLKINFKGWGKQSKFVLKANWIDITHARNVVSARLWGDIIKTRSDYTTALPELLRTSPNQGAIDGFPVLVYSNGVYQGRYTLNIPKDKWMSNMDDALDTHCILCGENYQSGCFRALPQINGTDWTDELHDVVPATIKTSWTNAINFVMTSSDDEFKTNLSNYFDVNSLIDYYLYGLVSTNLDGFGKNQLFFTYDGVHWIASVYDLDSTWGLWWNGSKFVTTTYSRKEFQDHKDGQGNQLYDRLEQLFIPQLKARYTELRKDVLSASHIIQKFEEFNQVCPKDIVQEDYASTTGEGKFTDIPSTITNNIQQLRSYINARLTYVDSYINALQEEIPCTNITLNNTTLSFTTTDTQTLIATLTPTNTTNTVTWSVSPTGIVTVNAGVVTPVKNGSCTITATCGTKSATCNVNVSGITEQPSDIFTQADYSLTIPTTFNGTSDYIDTNIKLFDTPKDFTLYIDFTDGTGNEINDSVFHCIYEQTPYRGLCLNWLDNNKFNIGGQDFSKSGEGYLNNLNAGKYLIEFKNGVISRVLNNSRELSIIDSAKNNSPYVQHDKNLLIGCYQTVDGTKGRYWNGTINKFGVWFKTLTTDEINNLLNIQIGVNLLEGVTWSAEADNGITKIGQEKGSGKGDAYLSGQIPCEKKKYVLSNINGATFLYKEMYVYASDGTYLGGCTGDGKYSSTHRANATPDPVTMDLRNINEEPAYMKITVFPNNVASNNSPSTQLKLVVEE